MPRTSRQPYGWTSVGSSLTFFWLLALIFYLIKIELLLICRTFLLLIFFIDKIRTWYPTCKEYITCGDRCAFVFPDPLSLHCHNFCLRSLVLLGCINASIRRCETINLMHYRRGRERPKKSWNKVIRSDEIFRTYGGHSSR